MRGRWLFRPALSPEQLADMPEAVTVTDAKGEPFVWQPQVWSRHGWMGWEGRKRGGCKGLVRAEMERGEGLTEMSRAVAARAEEPVAGPSVPGLQASGALHGRPPRWPS